MALRELCSYIPTPTWYRIAIGVATVAKIAMDFSCPCSKVLSPVWICFEKDMYSYWLFPTSVGQILYRQAKIWVWITRSKVLSWSSSWGPHFPNVVPSLLGKRRLSPFSWGSPNIYDTGIPWRTQSNWITNVLHMQNNCNHFLSMALACYHGFVCRTNN